MRNRAGGRPRTWTGRGRPWRSSFLQQGLSADVARSLIARRGDRDPFAQEQVALDGEPILATPPGVATVTAERAVRGDDPMTRDEQAHRVPPERPADGPGGPWCADPPGDLTIGRRFAPWDPGDGGEHVAIPARPIRQIERREGRRPPTGEERIEGGYGDTEVSEAQVASGPPEGDVDRSAEAPAETSPEAIGIDEPFDGYDPSVGGGHLDGAPRTGRRGGRGHGIRRAAVQVSARKIVTAFWPPNPNPFTATVSTLALRAFSGT